MDARYEYLVDENRALYTAQELQDRLNSLGAVGWRVIEIGSNRIIMERSHSYLKVNVR